MKEKEKGKKSYNEPSAEIVILECDVITASGNDGKWDFQSASVW